MDDAPTTVLSGRQVGQDDEGPTSPAERYFHGGLENMASGRVENAQQVQF